MRNTGLFVGEKIGGKECFYPDKEVSRGEFLAMMIQSLDIPVEEVSYTGIPEDTPDWLKPYLAAALRSGLIAGWPSEESGSFLADQAITGAEAAVMLQNALQLPVPAATEGSNITATGAMDGFSAEAAPAWACASLSALADAGMNLPDPTVPLTRLQAAKLLYQAEKLSNRST